jgi:hypothetical protein
VCECLLHARHAVEFIPQLAVRLALFGVGVMQVTDEIWLVSFMHYDLGYFDDETCRLEPIENPFGPKVLPMSPE